MNFFSRLFNKFFSKDTADTRATPCCLLCYAHNTKLKKVRKGSEKKIFNGNLSDSNK